MPDPFATLPAPLPLMIFEALEDLSTAHCLLQASPAANATFEECYCKITEAILCKFVPKLQQLLRRIIIIRSDALSIKDDLVSPRNLDNFLATCVLDKNFGATPLSTATVSLSAVRSFISSARHIQEVSASFFEEFLSRVNNIKPSYLLNQSYRYSRKYPRVLPEGRTYEPVKCGPPSWVEEQRVHRALWRLELYFNLVEITKPSSESDSQVWNLLKDEGPHRVWLEWPITDAELASICGGAIPTGLLPDWQADEMDDIYGFLYEFSGGKMPRSAQQPHLAKLPAIAPKDLATAQPLPYQNATVANWYQSPIHLEQSAPAVHFFQIFLHDEPFSPLYNSSFKPFRRLGFGIWDREKMARLGLIHLSHYVQPPRVSEIYWVGPFQDSPKMDDLYFRWTSLVNGDHVYKGED